MAKGRKKATYEELYANYKKAYSIKSAKSKIRLESMYTFQEFKGLYEAELSDRMYEVEEGTRKTLGAINRDLVNRQVGVYYNREQTKAMTEALRVMKKKDAKVIEDLFGQDMNFREAAYKIRGGEFKEHDFWEIIKDFREQQLDLGLSKKDANLFVSQYFFGSR